MKHHTTMVDAFNFVESVDVNSIKDSKNIRCIEEEIIISKRKVISTMMQDVNFLITNVNNICEVNLKQYNNDLKNNLSYSFRNRLSIENKKDSNKKSNFIIFYSHSSKQKIKKESNDIFNTKSFSKDKKMFINYLWDFPNIKIQKLHKQLRSYGSKNAKGSYIEVNTLINRASKKELKEVLRPSEYSNLLPYMKEYLEVKIPNPFDFVKKHIN